MEHHYRVGAEKSLKELIKQVDLVPLFKSAVRAGASEVILEDAGGHIMFNHGGPSDKEVLTEKYPIYLEGEIAGNILIKGSENREVLEDIGRIVLNATKLVLRSSSKSIHDNETHKSSEKQSYAELLEKYNKLIISERDYRELYENLEEQLLQRTEELKRAHAKLLQQDKIASVGQLAAGVAHEINNPLGFISSNINTLSQYMSKFKDMLMYYRNELESEKQPSGIVERTNQKWSKLKLDYIFSDVEELIKESRAGAERVQKIVSDLKGFSHIDEAEQVDIDINREIDRVLNVLSHEIPKNADIIRDYGRLPLFTCNAAQIGQVFFNLILNAIQSKKDGLKLTITTRSNNLIIRVAFSDNGPGIPSQIKNLIFEPFFTTKAVGTGTGLGLNVAYEIISSYGGSIEVDSGPDKGSTFSISLPIPLKNNDA